MTGNAARAFLTDGNWELHTTEQMAAARRIYRTLGFRRDLSGDVELPWRTAGEWIRACTATDN